MNAIGTPEGVKPNRVLALFGDVLGYRARATGPTALTVTRKEGDLNA